MFGHFASQQRFQREELSVQEAIYKEALATFNRATEAWQYAWAMPNGGRLTTFALISGESAIRKAYSVTMQRRIDCVCES